jgi:hypothetical protein
MPATDENYLQMGPQRVLRDPRLPEKLSNSREKNAIAHSIPDETVHRLHTLRKVDFFQVQLFQKKNLNRSTDHALHTLTNCEAPGQTNHDDFREIAIFRFFKTFGFRACDYTLPEL